MPRISAAPGVATGEETHRPMLPEAAVLCGAGSPSGMYPRVRELLPELEDDVLESFEEHHVADVLTMELAAMSADAERFDAKTMVLIESVTHHIEEEEQDWFPKVRARLGRKQLQEIGAELEEARQKAPTSPTQPSALKKTIDAVLA